MKLQIVKTKNARSYYMVKSVYDPKTKKNSSKIVEKLGTHSELLKKHKNPKKWAEKYVKEQTLLEKEGKVNPINITLDPNKEINNKENITHNIGYIFLKNIFYSLGLDIIFKKISKNNKDKNKNNNNNTNNLTNTSSQTTTKYKFKYDLCDIVEKTVFSRILHPSSKLDTYTISKTLFVEEPNFNLQDLYRSLDVISQESDYIQSELYKNSNKLFKRNNKVLYYDCTNYFFEIEKVDGLKQFGMSKEHRPNPIVQMGLFIDGDGIPLSFSINPGNTNEQTTLKPLEKQIIKDFNLNGSNNNNNDDDDDDDNNDNDNNNTENKSKLIICTDAGLSSIANRKFNSVDNRYFITSYSIKGLKKEIKEVALSNEGWRLLGDNISCNSKSNFNNSDNYSNKNINTNKEKEIIKEKKEREQEKEDNDNISNNDNNINNTNNNTNNTNNNIKYYTKEEIDKDSEYFSNKVFFKEFIYFDKKNNLKERYIITYSLEYKTYQSNNREDQINKAIKNLNKTPSLFKNYNSKNYKHYIKEINYTDNNEIANNTKFELDEDIILEESKYDGLYVVCTNLNESINEIVRISKERWIIEDCFRIMKTEFKARPVYLSRDNRIKAHFLICFLSLIIYKYLDRMLNDSECNNNDSNNNNNDNNDNNNKEEDDEEKGEIKEDNKNKNKNNNIIYDEYIEFNKLKYKRHKKYTCSNIIKELKNMNVVKISSDGYIPVYKDTEFVSTLHKKFNLKTNYQIITTKNMRDIFKFVKTNKIKI